MSEIKALDYHGLQHFKDKIDETRKIVFNLSEAKDVTVDNLPDVLDLASTPSSPYRLTDTEGNAVTHADLIAAIQSTYVELNLDGITFTPTAYNSNLAVFFCVSPMILSENADSNNLYYIVSVPNLDYVLLKVRNIGGSAAGTGVKTASYEENGTLTIVNESDNTYTVKLIPVDDISDGIYGVYNKKISVQDKQDSNAEILLTGQQAMVLDHTGGRVGRVTSVMADAIASMYAFNGDVLDTENQPTQYNAISASSGDDHNGASLTVQSSFNSGASNITAVLTAMNLIFTKNIAGSAVSAQIGFDSDNLGSNDITIVLTDAEGKRNYYAVRATDLNNDRSNPAYLATEDLVETKQNILMAGQDIKIENDVISVEEDWSIAIFDTEEFNKGPLSIASPEGYVFDKLYVLCHWYGNAAAAATNIYGGFYQGAVTDASKQVLRNNGTNKMGAGYFTANIVNIDNMTAIAYGEAYLYNNNGSSTSLNNPINSYGIGRYSHSNDFTHFTIHNYPSGITEGYCCIKYKLKKQ